MAAIDLNFAIGDDLLDETLNFVNDHGLNWLHFIHDAFYAFFKHDDFIVQFVENLLGVPIKQVLSLVIVISIGIFHINQKVLVLGLRLSDVLLCSSCLVQRLQVLVESILFAFKVFYLLVLVVLASGECFFILFSKIYLS